MNTNTNSVSVQTNSSHSCPTYLKYGIPVTLAVTSAVYYGYKWFMAKNTKPEQHNLDKEVLDKMTVVSQTATAPNTPVQTIANKQEVPETTLANH